MSNSHENVLNNLKKMIAMSQMQLNEAIYKKDSNVEHPETQIRLLTKMIYIISDLEAAEGITPTIDLKP